MTLQELYFTIDGDYEKALSVLRMDKLLDKHIRRLPDNAIFPALFAAGESLDASGIFESAHAIKGVCANLGLLKLSEAASELCEEFREGNARKLSDEEVRARVKALNAQYQETVDGIRAYIAEN